MLTTRFIVVSIRKRFGIYSIGFVPMRALSDIAWWDQILRFIEWILGFIQCCCIVGAVLRHSIFPFMYFLNKKYFFTHLIYSHLIIYLIGFHHCHQQFIMHPSMAYLLFFFLIQIARQDFCKSASLWCTSSAFISPPKYCCIFFSIFLQIVNKIELLRVSNYIDSASIPANSFKKFRSCPKFK